MASKQEKVLTGTNPKAFVDGLHIVSDETTADGMRSTIVVLWDIRFDPMFVPPEMVDVKTSEVDGEKQTSCYELYMYTHVYETSLP